MTVAIGSTLADVTALHPLDDSFIGTHIAAPEMMHAMANMVVDATPDFYLENIKRLVAHGIQPYFALPHIHGLELVERLIRRGYYMGPMNGFYSIGGGGYCGANPVRPHGTDPPIAARFGLHLPDHLSPDPPGLGHLHRPRPAHPRRYRGQSLGHHQGRPMTAIEMIERHVRMAEELGRPIATPEQARQMLKIGVTYRSTAETLANLGLPPNRHEGQQGFLVHETDGKLPTKTLVASDSHALAL